jgi:RNA polymerase sigma factor (sigma-70 family)
MITRDIPVRSDIDYIDYSSRLNIIKKCAFAIIKEYDFIKPWERQDYLQEACMYIWSYLHTYDPAKGAFGTWAYQAIRWAFLGYRKKIRRHVERMTYMEDISSWYDRADIVGDNEHLEALDMAIADLPVEKREVVNMYLEGYNLSEVSVRNGKNRTYYTNKLMDIRKDILRNRKKYFEDIEVQDRKLKVIPNGRRNENSKLARQIVMLDMEGKFLRTWPSLSEAERNGFCSRSISMCVNGKMFSHRGYRWRFSNEQRPEILDRKKAPRGGKKSHRRIDQLTLSGELVKVWASVHDLHSEGFDMGTVKRAIKGVILKSYRGFKWRYSEEIAT